MRTVRELSAGGVIYRRHKDRFEIVLIHVRRRWGLPKGHVEQGETVDQAALREVREETGLEGKIVKQLGDITYWYRTKSKEGEPVRIFKRVHFFLLRYHSGDVAGHDHEVDEARWFPIGQALQNLVFSTERRMVRRARNILARRKPYRRRARIGKVAADGKEQSS
jgi:8-oxo-dGTP pyrophosphatase MutT (NUDIX family)